MVWPLFGDHSEKMQAIIRILTSDDDVVTAVLGGALLEEAVERTLRERMANDKHGVARLFDLDKPLAPISPQVDILYMLWGADHGIKPFSVVSEKLIWNAMRGIAKIRNVFAHNLGVTFGSNDAALTKAFNDVTLHKYITYYPDPRTGKATAINVEDATTRREQFIINLKLCLNFF